MNARIEIRPTTEDGWVVTMLNIGLRQRNLLDHDGAVRIAMAWCVESWAHGVDVDIAEYDHGQRVRWQAQELRALDDLRDLAAAARFACAMAVAAEKEAGSG